jgi:hypothetical protein
MPVVALSDPYKTNGALTSKWVAIHSGGGVKFKFQRTDFLATSSANAAGNTKLNISSGTVPTLVVGGTVWVTLANGQTGNYLVVANTSSSVTINLAWSGATTTGTFNLITHYANYYLTVKFQYSTDAGATFTDYVTGIIYKMSPTNYCYVDATPFTKSLLAATNQAIYGIGNNDVATDLDSYIKMSVTETDDIRGTVEAITPQYLHIVNAANQLQNTNGCNMLSYMTNSTPTQTMKFLSDFEQPTYFKGMPFLLYFIHSELMTGISWDAMETETTGSESNPVVQAQSSYIIDISKIGHVNRYAIKGTYSANSKYIYVLLKKNSAVDEYSETKVIRYNPSTLTNKVCLKWIGPSGGWNYWVFPKKQGEEINQTTKQGEFSPYISDLATSDTDSDFITKEANPSLKIIQEGLDANDIGGLRTLLTSPKVMMLQNASSYVYPTSNDKWLTVRINAGKISLGNNDDNFRSIEFNLELPELYLQMN